MAQPDQEEMFDILEMQHKNQVRVDRAFKIVIPITAFLLCVICANFNIWSTIFTFVVLWISFYAVSIKRLSLGLWVAIICVYCLIDNILSYGTFKNPSFIRQFGTMFIFLGIFGVGRPYIDRWFLKK